jgi:hypothetical protein
VSGIRLAWFGVGGGCPSSTDMHDTVRSEDLDLVMTYSRRNRVRKSITIEVFVSFAWAPLTVLGDVKAFLGFLPFLTSVAPSLLYESFFCFFIGAFPSFALTSVITHNRFLVRFLLVCPRLASSRSFSGASSPAFF